MKTIRARSDELNFPLSPKVQGVLKSIPEDAVQRYWKEPPLLERLAREHSVPVEALFLEDGIMGIMHRTLDYVLGRRSRILLPDLSFPPYLSVARRTGACIDLFKVRKGAGGFAYDLDDLRKKLRKNPDIIVLVDPESPLGFSLPQGKLEEVMGQSNPRTLVLLDQAHEGFREHEVKDAGALARTYPNILVARDFSKFYGMAGLRLAYAVCGEDVKGMINFQERYLGFNNASQLLGIAALESKEYYLDVAQTIRSEKERFNRSLREMGYATFETDHMSSVVEVTSRQRAAINALCAERDVQIRDLATYHEELTNLYRISMGPKEDNDKLLKIFGDAR